MRVQLEVGDRSVDVENNPRGYLGGQQDQMFFDLLRGALEAIGYTELEMLMYLTGVAREAKEKNEAR